MLLLMFYLEEIGKMPNQWSNWWCEGKYKEDLFFMDFLIFCHMMWKVEKKLGKYLTYVLKDELLYYNFNWLCIPTISNYRWKILYDYHNIPIVGHLGF
jgi:hypothetical protein